MTPKRKRERNQLDMDLEELREEASRLAQLEQRTRKWRESVNSRAKALEERQREWFAARPAVVEAKPKAKHGKKKVKKDLEEVKDLASYKALDDEAKKIVESILS